MVEDIPPYRDNPPANNSNQSACVCPNCGHREPAQLTIPCYTRKCPRCGSMMSQA